MSTSIHDAFHLENDTVVNIASLLKQDVGSKRDYTLSLDRLALDQDLVATDLTGSVRLTRLRDSVLASGSIAGTTELECARCLNRYDQPFNATFTEEFRQTVDVQGGEITKSEYTDDDDEPGFEINDAHELDLSEMLRQWIVLDLPMKPDCGELCPGPPEMNTNDASEGDDRFAALKELLDEE